MAKRKYKRLHYEDRQTIEAMSKQGSSVSPLNTGEKSYDVGNIYQYYAYSLAALVAGGYWNDGADCGARAVFCSRYPWIVNTAVGARGACDSL